MTRREEIEAAIKVVFPDVQWLSRQSDRVGFNGQLQYGVVVECWADLYEDDPARLFRARVTWDSKGSGTVCVESSAVEALKAACDLFCRQTEAEVKALTTRLQFVNRFR